MRGGTHRDRRGAMTPRRCRCLSRCDHGTSLSFGQVAVLCLINLNEAFHINVIWSFAPFMMKDLGVAEDSIGVYVGWLATCFFVAQFASSIAWGKLSDRIGRRPTLLLGLAGSSVPMFMLGLSSTTGFAIAMRAVSGLLNGNIGVSVAWCAV